MNSKEKLTALKDNFIKQLDQNVYENVYLYVTHNQSNEEYMSLNTFEANIYTFKELLNTYFPEVDVKEIISEAKEKALVQLSEEEYHETDSYSEAYYMTFD